MFTIPALQARKPCTQARDAVNLAFVSLPFINVAVPFFQKSFLAIYLTDVASFSALLFYCFNVKKYLPTEYDYESLNPRKWVEEYKKTLEQEEISN